MSKDRPPSFQFYPADFLADISVVLMTPEQRGGYISLLCHAWLSDSPGTLPNDDRILSVLSGLGERWGECREPISKAFRVTKHAWAQKRMIQEREAQILRHERASEGGKSTQRAFRDNKLASIAPTDSCNPRASTPLSSSLFPSSEESKSTPLVPTGTVRRVVDPAKAEAAKDWRESFDEYFWPTYLPLRAGLPNPKADALAVWLKVKEPSQEVFDALSTELEACIKSWADTDPRYIPHARKWLHERIRGGIFYPTGGA